MARFQTAKCRTGKPTLDCLDPDTLVIFTFGIDYQEIISCVGTDKIVGSEFACLRSTEEEAYVSAQYKVISPTPEDGNLLFNATLNLKVNSTNEACGNGEYPPLVLDVDNLECVDDPQSSVCIQEETNTLPKAFIDTDSISVSVDNQGLATLSVSLVSRTEEPLEITSFSLNLGKSEFFGFIESINPSRLEGTNYIEYRIRAFGEVVEEDSASVPGALA